MALKLLRDGARVTVTTRFPADAARRYAQEPDFAEWRDSLRLYGLDLRDLAGVHRFVASLERSGDLNILINNAAQTIRRPPKYYEELCSGEQAALPAHARKLLIGSPGSMAPELVLKSDVCMMRSSWALPMEEVDTLELAEVMVINAMVPFVLCSQLEPLMKRSRYPDRYVVNVSSAEGQFDRKRKPATHPHTNMAKAALNMLTRTAAECCAASRICMNSVDPGWITHMQSVEPHSPAENEAFVPPLDVEDGAARLYDPILRGIAGEPVFGLLLRDYSAVPW